MCSSSQTEIRVSCLPVAGPENPYQQLMMDGLRSNALLQVQSGEHGKFFALTKTYLKQKPKFIHFDWISRYFIRNPSWLSYINGPIFVSEVLFVKYVFNCNIVWTLHNLSRHDAKSFWLEKWVRQTFARCCTWVRVFDHTSVQRASKTLNIEKSRILVIPEGSYIGYYPNEVTRPQARVKLKIGTEKLVFLYLGYLRPYKGIEALITAFKKISKKDWSLIIAGKPYHKDYAASISKLLGNDSRITFMPDFIKNQDLQLFYNASDFVVCPFNNIENSGSIVLAMGFRKPIIAPKIGVIESKLRCQKSLLYRGGDLTETLNKASKMNKEDRLAIGDQNHEHLKDHRWSNFADAFDQK